MKKTIRFGKTRIEISQPLRDRPGLILIVASDGRRTVLPEIDAPLTLEDYRTIEEKHERQPIRTRHELEGPIT